MPSPCVSTLTLLFLVSLVEAQQQPAADAHKEYRQQQAQRLRDEHLKEHIGDQIDTEKYKEEEEEFYQFQMYDLDNDNQLSGLEIWKALEHNFYEHSDNGTDTTMYDEVKLEKETDEILNIYDKNNDGYVSYMEFRFHEDEKTKDEEKTAPAPA